MKMTLAISVVGCVIAVSSFVLARKDKAVNETKEEASEQRLIEYRLNELTRKVDKILEKLDNQETEIKMVVNEEIEKHVLQYHKGS
jgi:tRNA splicing ligase